jgi:mannose/cellobiose epimerase-like protein (N-acyl-D-glucosamine 2-epimerase family)
MYNDEQTAKEKLQKLYDVALAEATGNILPFWMNHALDLANGGFYCNSRMCFEIIERHRRRERRPGGVRDELG